MEKSIHSQYYGVFLNLKQYRRKAALTQIQLAEKLGETQTFVSKCERGERRIDVIELRTFCEAFGISLSQFSTRLEREIRRLR